MPAGDSTPHVRRKKVKSKDKIKATQQVRGMRRA
jgi:hypothetical protein